ncbi:MAG: hypothetical protein PWP39_1026 [Pyrococcus sp.]|nr:hypothetical protein [Pyrococcus sp.]
MAMHSLSFGRSLTNPGIYYIPDNYFAFWFHYVYSNADLIESGNGELLVDTVMDDIDYYTAEVFEDVAKEFLLTLNKSGRLPFRFTRIGRWWYKNEEIDLVAGLVAKTSKEKTK